MQNSAYSLNVKPSNVRASGARASDTPVIPMEQLGKLFTALSQVEQGEETNLVAVQAYLEEVVLHIFRALGRGNPEALEQALEVLRPVEAFAARHLPTEYEPKARAGIKAYEWMEALRTIQEALAQPALERQNRQHSKRQLETPAYREVLEILRAHPEQALQKSSISSKMKSGVSESRVSQILSQLCQQGFVQRIQRPARGGMVPFYSLSPSGHAMCEQEGVSPSMPTPKRPTLAWARPDDGWAKRPLPALDAP